MDLKNMGALVGGLVVSVILLAAVLVPVISEATETHTTFSNAGFFDMKYTDNEDITLVWDYENPTQVTINDEVVPLDDVTVSGVTIMTGDTWFLRFQGNAVAIDSSTIGTFGANVANSQTMTIVATDGTMTATVSADGATDSSKTYTYTYLYTIDAEGEYVMKLPTEKAYLNADSKIYGAGGTVLFSGVYTLIKSEGSYDDGITSTVFKPTSGYTVTDVDPNFETESDYIDLYTLDSFVITVSNGSTTDTATYSYFIVPAEVTAEKASHMSNTEISLVEIIPLLVTVGIIIGIIGMAFSRRE